DGRPIYEGQDPNVPLAAQDPVVAPGSAVISAARQNGSLIEDDVTADKSGSPAAAERTLSLLDEYVGGEHLNTRAEKCYRLLAELKKNVETVARCLDNRGKENALLVHTADLVAKNITELADIWPSHDEYIDRCASSKRYALIFGEELSRSPWRWAQV